MIYLPTYSFSHLSVCFISTSKSVPTPWFLNILTSKCALRHNGLQFFEISTSKSGPNIMEMCFAAQLQAIFAFLVLPDGSAPTALASPFSTLPTHKSLEKHSVSRFSEYFAHLYLLSSDSTLLFFSPLWLFPHLLFISLHIVESLTSKLPLINLKND